MGTGPRQAHPEGLCLATTELVLPRLRELDEVVKHVIQEKAEC